jgi:plastocyanin
MPKGRVTKALGPVILLIATAGCGHTVVARDGTARIALTEYRLIPQNVRAPAGEVTIDVHNAGRLTHNFTLMRGERTTAETGPMQPGQRIELVLPLTPGKYVMASTLLSDRDLGIYGTLTVTR